jgi:transposase-like protein
MRKHQRYSQEEMYAAIEHCHKDNISYAEYCANAGIHYATFKYWIKKYHREQPSPKTSFLPVHVAPESNLRSNFTITFPNGTRLDCPSTTPTEQLAALIKS